MDPYFQKVIETPLIDLTGSVPLTAGTGPLPNGQVDPRIQERKEKRMETIMEWIAEEQKDYVKLNDKEKELKETVNLTDVVRAKLERSKRKQELYTEMLSETSGQVGKLWGENPAVEWIHEMRVREWSSYGVSLDQKVHEAYEKEVEKLKQAVEDLTWSTVRPK